MTTVNICLTYTSFCITPICFFFEYPPLIFFFSSLLFGLLYFLTVHLGRWFQVTRVQAPPPAQSHSHRASVRSIRQPSTRQGLCSTLLLETLSACGTSTGTSIYLCFELLMQLLIQIFIHACIRIFIMSLTDFFALLSYIHWSIHANSFFKADSKFLQTWM